MDTLFLFISSTQKFKAFSTFINPLSCAIAETFAVCGATEKLAQIFFIFSSSLHEWKIRSCHTIWQYPHTIFFFYFNHIQNFHFLTNGKDTTVPLRLRSTISITTLTLWGNYYSK